MGALSGVVILLLIPSINQFFRLDEGYVFLFFTPLVFVGMYSAMARGYLAGTLLFSIVAFTTLFEALVKLLSAIALVSAGLEEWAYVSVPFSLVVACILLFFLVRHYRPVLVKVEVDSEVTRFPKKFYLASVFNGSAYVCVNGQGRLFRSITPCTSATGAPLYVSNISALIESCESIVTLPAAA
jgi:signal transduction histidine kinase